MKFGVTINGVDIELSEAKVSIQDHNDTIDSDDYLPMVEVVVWVGRHGFVYQTSPTMDMGGVSSRLTINRESGAYDSVLSMLKSIDAIDYREDEDEQVYTAGKLIGDVLDVQSVFDDYMSEQGKSLH